MLLRRFYTSLPSLKPHKQLNHLSPPKTKPHLFSFSNKHKPLSTTLSTRAMSSDTTTTTTNNNNNNMTSATPDKSTILRSLEQKLGSSFSTTPIIPPPTPLILVISGPSGVGKDSVINKLSQHRPNLHFVVNATSRQKRPGEVDGRDYYFITKEQFLNMVEKGELLEHALVYGDYKGIPKEQIREALGKGKDVVLRVDVQGAETLRGLLGESGVFVFVCAESECDMVERLVGRKTESEEMLFVRIATAREEVKFVGRFDYVVVNREGKLDEAVSLVGSIIDAEKAKVRQRRVVI